jgi:prephenate dehydrogenase
MTIQITIIGLGQIGASVGLALADHKETIRRVGHDRKQENARRAEKLGALDKIEINLHAAVRGADLVLLSLPLDQIRETMSMIALDLKDGAVVMDTAPVKETVAAWAGELLPGGRHYVGLTPVINPAYLHEAEYGLLAAHGDLFHKGLIAIVTPARTNSEAIKLAADLTRLLGASPLFADPLEIDSLMAATHLVPQLLAAALLNATIDQPGWREARKLAGRAYAEATGPIVQLGDIPSLQASILLNHDNVVRIMDSVIAALQNIRNDINSEDKASLEERLGRARQGRETWWNQRQVADWASSDGMPTVETPTSSDVFGRLIGLNRKPKKKS